MNNVNFHKQEQTKYLTNERFLQDIHFNDTVCIFQDINSLFFFYKFQPPTTPSPHSTTKKIYFNTNHRKTIKKRV